MSILRVPVTAAPGPSGLASWIRYAANAINQNLAETESGVGDGDKGDIVVSDSGATWEFDSSVVSAFARTILDDSDATTVRSTIAAQQEDATLTALAGLNATAGLVEQTGADAFTKRAIGVASATDILTRGDGDGRYSLTSHNHDADYQPLDTQLTDLAALSYTGNASKVVAVNATEDGFELVAGGGGGSGTTTNSLTINSSGSGAASGATFNGSAAVTISYNTVGAQPLDADLTAIAALTTAAAGRSALELSDPNADRIMFWDDSAGAVTWLSLSGNLEISGTTLKPKHRGCLVALASDGGSTNYTAGVAVAFGASTEAYDTDGIHDEVTSNTRLTVPSGVSRVRVSGQISHTTTGTSGSFDQLHITKNGSTAYAGFPFQIVELTSTVGRVQVSSPVLAVTPGDYFELIYTSESDTSIVLQANFTWFAMDIIE